MVNGKFIPLSISIAGNIFLVWLFLNAMLNPLENTDMIFKTGILIFIIEFLSIHSGVLLAPINKTKTGWRGIFHQGRIFLVLLYSFMVIIPGTVLGNLYMPALFVISLLSKTSGNLASYDISKAATYVMVFTLCIFIVVFGFAAQIISLFPFPEKVFEYKIENSSGLFVDAPQTLLLWGIVYFSLSIAVEILFFARKWNRRS